MEPVDAFFVSRLYRDVNHRFSVGICGRRTRSSPKNGTQLAAPLLVAARELEVRKGVLAAVEETMGAMAIRSFRSIV